MAKHNSNYSSFKVIDFRNGRYQGLINNNKKHGIGMLIDDDLNIYCSEWQHDQICGTTFVWNKAHYMYGSWKSHQPHGLNIYKNNSSTVISKFQTGHPVGNALVVPNSLSHMVILDAADIIANKNNNLQIKSFQNLYNSSLSSDMIFHCAHKNQIKIQEHQFRLLKFLQNMADKHQDHLQFIQTGYFYYFGFKHGLGFNFTLSGKNNHIIQMITIGSHENGRLTDFGRKYYDNKTIQQGNFQTKQTITYNRFTQRPKQKCNHIFNKIHKKSLHFINQYYEFKRQLFVKIDDFLNGKFHKACQECIQLEYMQKKLQTKNVSPSRREFYRQARQEFKKSNKSIRQRSQSTLFKSKSAAKLIKNSSKQSINKKIVPQAVKLKKQSHQNMKDASTSSWIDHTNIARKKKNPQLSYKLVTECQRCLSKQRRQQQKEIKNNGPNKQNAKQISEFILEKNSKYYKSKSKSKSKSDLYDFKNKPREKSQSKLQNQKAMKQLKQLADYKHPNSLSNTKKANQKSSSNLFNKVKQQNPYKTKEQRNIQWAIENELGKQKLRIENEKKIRQELYEKEIKRQISKKQILINRLQDIQSVTYNETVPISQFSPNRYLQPHYQHQYQRILNNSVINDFHLQIAHRSPQRPYKNPERRNIVGTALSELTNNHLDILQDRRQKLLRQYKYLNDSNHNTLKVSHTAQQISNANRPDRSQYTMMTLLQSSRQKFDKIQQKIHRQEQFNRKYRNYLLPQLSKRLQQDMKGYEMKQDKDEILKRRDKYEYLYDQ